MDRARFAKDVGSSIPGGVVVCREYVGQRRFGEPRATWPPGPVFQLPPEIVLIKTHILLSAVVLFSIQNVFEPFEQYLS